MNKVILVGRLTADPELRQSQSGVSSCRFTVAVDRRFADKNTGERGADFITCTAFRQTAEFVSRYFSKGKMILVEGTIRNDNYPDRKYPDVMHYSYSIFVDNVEFVGGKNESGGNNGGNGNYGGNAGGYNNGGYGGNGNYGGNGGYGDNSGYNGNNSYQNAPAQQSAPQQPQGNSSMNYGKASEFEALVEESDVPF